MKTTDLNNITHQFHKTDNIWDHLNDNIRSKIHIFIEQDVYGETYKTIVLSDARYKIENKLKSYKLCRT